MTFKTEKLYYKNQNQLTCDTRWRKINSRTIAVAESVAYPEGGGQLSDTGTIAQNGTPIAFLDCQKKVGNGRTIVRRDFPLLNVDGEIHLHLAEDLPETFDESTHVTMEIDSQRRLALTRCHSASHLVYLAMTKLRPEVPTATRGCRIAENEGRFDVSVEKYTDEDVAEMTKIANSFRLLCLPISISTLENEIECRFWNMDSFQIACGGTHVENSAQIPEIKLRKKNQSKGVQRIYFEIVVGP